MKLFFAKRKQEWRERSSENLFRLDGCVPLSKAIPLGIQHVLSMFVANIVPLLLIFKMAGADAALTNNGIRSAIFIAAIGTIIQLFPIGRVGARLPIVVGLSFTFVGVLGLVGAQYGVGTMFISVMIGGVLIGVLGLFAKYWRRFIKPIVSSTVVLGIGLSLLAVGIKQFTSYDVAGIVVDGVYQWGVAWPYLVVAASALLSSLLFQIFVKGVWKNINILVGLIVGYVVALAFRLVDFSNFPLQNVTDFIDVPKPVFFLHSFSWSDFKIGPILIVLLIYLVASTEGIGDLSSLANAGLGRDATDREISGGLAADGFTSALSGLFGALPLTTFSQNVGIVAQTKVVNRFTIFQGCLLLLLASFFPILSNFLMTIPDAVLGGCMVMLFASIVVVGMEMLSKCGFNKKNTIIVSLSIGIGYGITLIPAFTTLDEGAGDFLPYLMLVLQNPVANMFLISLLLSYALPDSLNGVKQKRVADGEQEHAGEVKSAVEAQEPGVLPEVNGEVLDQKNKVREHEEDGPKA